MAGLSAPAGVSRETPIYFRMLEWAAWATNRRDLPDRRDELAGDFRLTPDIRKRIREALRNDLTPEYEAIEKAVGSLGFEHDDKQLQFMLKEYFLEWKSIEAIALEQNSSEFHVEADLQRALRKLARRLSWG